MSISSADVFRQHGVQRTAQRLAVLDAVTLQPHSSADAVTEFAKSDIGSISRQAVYDALNVLVEKGLLRRIQPVGSPALYERRVDDNHHHVMCRLCGAVGDVDCAVGHTPCLTAANDLGFDIDEAEVVYWGRCPTCQASGESATRLDPKTDRRKNVRNIDSKKK